MEILKHFSCFTSGTQIWGICRIANVDGPRTNRGIHQERCRSEKRTNKQGLHFTMGLLLTLKTLAYVEDLLILFLQHLPPFL